MNNSMTSHLNLDAARVQACAFLGPLLIPEARRQDLGGVAPVLVLVHNLRDLVKSAASSVMGSRPRLQNLRLDTSSSFSAASCRGFGKRLTSTPVWSAILNPHSINGVVIERRK
jgi:hypothetical protein